MYNGVINIAFIVYVLLLPRRRHRIQQTFEIEIIPNK